MCPPCRRFFQLASLRPAHSDSGANANARSSSCSSLSVLATGPASSAALAGGLAFAIAVLAPAVPGRYVERNRGRTLHDLALKPSLRSKLSTADGQTLAAPALAALAPELALLLLLAPGRAAGARPPGPVDRLSACSVADGCAGLDGAAGAAAREAAGAGAGAERAGAVLTDTVASS